MAAVRWRPVWNRHNFNARRSYKWAQRVNADGDSPNSDKVSPFLAKSCHITFRRDVQVVCFQLLSVRGFGRGIAACFLKPISMRFDLIARPDARHRWHWEVLGPFPAPGGGPRFREACCSPAAEPCPGFETEDAARESGQARVDELAGSDPPS
jgi:hypothetical protein